MTIEERLSLYDDIIGTRLPYKAKTWLLEHKYFSAPASTKYHLAYEGGLFEHSVNVTLSLLELSKNNNLKWSRPDSPYIIGMLHDLCKCDVYLLDLSNKVYIFDTKAPKGHGDKSVDYINKYILTGDNKLTEEETDCIRWHMGAFDEKENWKLYGEAIERHENVLWTHMADMIASKIIER